jgi:hypothetical protein
MDNGVPVPMEFKIEQAWDVSILLEHSLKQLSVATATGSSSQTRNVMLQKNQKQA